MPIWSPDGRAAKIIAFDSEGKEWALKRLFDAHDSDKLWATLAAIRKAGEIDPARWQISN
jgi:hypothetical protein